MNKIVASGLILFCLSLSSGQPVGRSAGFPASGVITGQVWDAEAGVPIEYANVVLYRMRDSSRVQMRMRPDTSRVVNGTVTDARGRFVLRDLPPGRYYLEVSFIGYRTRRLENLRLAPDERRELGRIELQPAAIAVQGTEVVGEKPRLEYRIDKKVLNVAQNPALQTGTAVDALEKAPAVKVDIEGNVRLRGLESFTVLIDGRPAPVEGSEALQQIPASTIDRIEIITNPSAKYDPEGRAGIINVILRKQNRSGLSGTVNVNAGNNGQYGGNILLTLRSGKNSFYVAPNYNRFGFPGIRQDSGWVIGNSGDTVYHQAQSGFSFGRRFGGLRLGADLQLTGKDWLSLGGRFGLMGGDRQDTARYLEWGAASGAVDTFYNRSYSLDRGLNFSFNLEATHNFGRTGHEVTLKADYGANRRKGTDSTISARPDQSRLSGKRTDATHEGNPLSVRLEYTRPLREKDRLEAGYQARLRFGPRESTRISEFNPDRGGYYILPEYSHSSVQTDYVHALYCTYSGYFRQLGAMGGLRVEKGERRVRLDTVSSTPFAQVDLFPSVHLSYQFPGEKQLMASYTRRVDRPRGWDLAPGLTWMDAKNVRQGNPELKPEYIDSYEVGLLLPMAGQRISVDGYYRMTHNVIEHFQAPWRGDTMLHTAKNVGSDRALGGELTFDLNPLKWWNLNLTGDIYDYRLDGQVGEGSISKKSFNWDANFTSEFALPAGIRLQLNGRYESPSATLQGSEGGDFRTGVAVRSTLFNRQLTLFLSLRDLIRTTAREDKTEGANFYSRRLFVRKGPSVSFGFTWNFNNYRPERRRTGAGENGEEELIRPYDEY